MNEVPDLNLSDAFYINFSLKLLEMAKSKTFWAWLEFIMLYLDLYFAMFFFKERCVFQAKKMVVS